LNVGDATQGFVENTLQALFTAADDLVASGVNFKLYISMDVYASGGSCFSIHTSCNGPFDYASIFSWALDRPSYYHAPNGNPMISSMFLVENY